MVAAEHASRPHLVRARVWAFATLGLLACPSGNIQIFDGLPLSSVAEYAALLWWMPCLFNRAVASRLETVVARIPVRAVMASIAVAFAAKMLLAGFGLDNGLAAIYGSPLAEPSGRHEMSFENPLGRHQATRVDCTIDFEPGRWNLVFLNSTRFNYYGPDAPHDRNRLPIQARWRGWVEADEPWVLRLDYVGELRVTIGGRTPVFPPRYLSSETVTMAVEAGRHALDVIYAFDDSSHDARNGPYARVRLCRSETISDTCHPLPLGRVAWPARLAGWAVDLLVVLLSIPLGLAYWRSGRLRRLVGAYLFLAASMTLATVVQLGPPGHVRLRTGGSDWLTSEGQAQSILETWSLRGGEDVFYSQPAFRYIRFLEHLILGDGDPFILATARLALGFAALWVSIGFVPARRTPGQLLAWLLASVLLFLWIFVPPSVRGLVWAGASEYPTWICLLAAWPLLLRPGQATSWLVGSVLIGVAFITRTNQLFGLAGLLVAALLLRVDLTARWRWLGVLATLVIASLPLAHNLYFGGEAVLLTTSAFIPNQIRASPGVWADAFSDAEARRLVVTQLRWLLVLEGPTHLRWIARGAQLLWLVSVAGLLAGNRRPPGVYLLAAVPALYLGVHLFYDVTSYFPRHVVAGHLAMALVALTLAPIREDAQSRQG